MIGLRTIGTLIEHGELDCGCDDIGLRINDGNEWDDITGATEIGQIEAWSPSKYDLIYDRYSAQIRVPNGFANTGSLIECEVSSPEVTATRGSKLYGGIYAGVATTTQVATGLTTFNIFTASALTGNDIHPDLRIGDVLHLGTGNTPTNSGPPLDVYGNSLFRLADSLDRNGDPIGNREIREIVQIVDMGTSSFNGGKSYQVTVGIDGRAQAFSKEVSQYQSLLIFPQADRLIYS